MRKEQYDKLKGRQVCFLPMGKEAFLMEQPGEDGLCGFRVPGEKETYWIHYEELIDMGAGALITRGGATYTIT